MKKFFYAALAGLFCVTLLLSVGCDAVDSAAGVNAKAGTVDPSGGSIGAVLHAADGLVPSPYNLITHILLGGLALYQSIRVKNQNAIIDSAQATIDATAAGLKSFSKLNPGTGETLADHIETAHAAADVDPAHTLAMTTAAAPSKA